MSTHIKRWTLHAAPVFSGWKRPAIESECVVGRSWDRDEEQLLKDWLRSQRRFA